MMNFRWLLFLWIGCFQLISLFDREKAFASDTASNGYDEDFIELIEMVYGNGYLSQGGKESVDQMFYGIDLNGKEILDLGSGLGGPSIYLAQNYQVEIVGIDPLPMMVQKARSNLNSIEIDLKGSVSFILMEDPHHLKQFSNHSFDLIFSKESILHVPLEVKLDYFKEVNRVLKPGGELVILDWLHDSPNYSTNTKKMMEMDGIPFYLVTISEYLDILEKAEFANIQFFNFTLDHTEECQKNLKTITSLADTIKARFGEDTYNYSLQSWTYQRDAFKSGELIVGHFRAKKLE